VRLERAFIFSGTKFFALWKPEYVNVRTKIDSRNWNLPYFSWAPRAKHYHYVHFELRFPLLLTSVVESEANLNGKFIAKLLPSCDTNWVELVKWKIESSQNSHVIVCHNMMERSFRVLAFLNSTLSRNTSEGTNLLFPIGRLLISHFYQNCSETQPWAVEKGNYCWSSNWGCEVHADIGLM